MLEQGKYMSGTMIKSLQNSGQLLLNVSPNARYIYAWMCILHVDQIGTVDSGKLVQKTKIAKQNVWRSLRELEKAGLIQKASGKRGQRQAQRWQMTLDPGLVIEDVSNQFDDAKVINLMTPYKRKGGDLN